MTHFRFIEHLTPEHGVGYYLGIVGGIAMLLLLVYPLKKRIRRMPVPWSNRFWFRAHMFLGILGPLLISFHSKLKLGSINSTVAFWFMMIVMLSGLVGRFLYQKIHMGLYGRRKDLSQLLEQLKEHIGKRVENGMEMPVFFERQIQEIPSLEHLRSMRRELSEAGTASVGVDALSAKYGLWVKKLDGLLGQSISLIVYERLFSWWHYLHLPIFFAFFIATVVHILAVHIY